MKKNLKFRIALTIMLALCMSAFTHKATAQFSGGDGSENNPYMITTAEQLAQLATFVNDRDENYNDKCYKLGNDISLAAYQSGEGWTPIGGDWSYYAFQGSFNGNNKKITDLYINMTGYQSYMGLFGYISEGRVYDLGVENANVTGNDAVGCVAGYICNSSTVTNCYSTGKVTGKQHLGGVVGEAFKSAITNCYSSCEVTGNDNSYSYTGGVIGEIQKGTISNCYSTGKVKGIEWVGGVAGRLDELCTMSNCYFTGEVSGIEDVGGVVGWCYGSSTMSNCYSTGKVSGNEDVGGIVGYLQNDCTLSNSYSTSEVSGNKYVGGVAGYVLVSYVKNCYATGKISGNTNIAGIAGYLGSTGTVSYCVALNPVVEGMGMQISRVVGEKHVTAALFQNAAWNGIKNINGNTNWDYKGANNFDGEDMSTQTIKSDGTLGGCFTAAGGWTTQNGKLPGLFGNTVDMPAHLSGGVGIVETSSLASPHVYPNPVNYELKITNYEGGDANKGACPLVEIYDVMGRRVATVETGCAPSLQTETTINVSFLPSGVYFLKINNKTIKFIKQ